MKKKVILALALCLLAVMMWKAKERTAELAIPQAIISEKKAAQQETLVDWGITMTVINATPTGCTLEITQSGGTATGEIHCGEDYYVQALAEDGWHNLEYIITDNYAIPSIAYIVSEDYPRNFNLNWQQVYGVLPSGTYRIAKELMDSRAPGDFDEAYHFSQSFVIE